MIIDKKFIKAITETHKTATEMLKINTIKPLPANIISETNAAINDLIDSNLKLKSFGNCCNKGNHSKADNKTPPITNKSTKKQKTVQTREHALNTLIKETYIKSKDKSPRAIWSQLVIIAQNEDSILQEVTSWSAKNPVIKWISPEGIEQDLQRNSFRNIIYKLKRIK
ncbi:hypothetical protein [Legionella sp. WA2022007384]